MKNYYEMEKSYITEMASKQLQNLREICNKREEKTTKFSREEEEKMLLQMTIFPALMRLLWTDLDPQMIHVAQDFDGGQHVQLNESRSVMAEAT